jgi:hypothetical protein
MRQSTPAAHEFALQNADIIDEREILRRVPISRRTLGKWRIEGKIPFLNLGGRRILYHWPSVLAALLRNQKNST